MIRDSIPSPGSLSSSRKRKYSFDSTSCLNSVDMPHSDLTKRANQETKPSPVELLLINLQFIQQQRIQAEAEAAAALMAVESIPQPMLEIAAIGIQTSPHGVAQRWKVSDADEGSGKEDEEVESGLSPPARGASEWADNVLNSVDCTDSYHELAPETALEAAKESPDWMQRTLNSAAWNTGVPIKVLNSMLGDNVAAGNVSSCNHLPSLLRPPTSRADDMPAAGDNILPPPPTSPAGRTEGDSDSDSPPAHQPIKKRQRRGTAADPQSLAARARRERIAKKIKVLHALVPGALQLDTASMLEKAIHHVRELERTLEDANQITCSTDMARTPGFPLQKTGIFC